MIVHRRSAFAPRRRASLSASVGVAGDPSRDHWLSQEMAGERQVERTWSTSTFLEDEHPSEVVRKYSKFDEGPTDLYERMTDNDASLESFALRRAGRVTSLPRWVAPGAEDADAVAAADLCRSVVGETGLVDPVPPGLEHFHVVLMKAAKDSVGKGVAMVELIWTQLDHGPFAGMWVPTKAIDRPPSRFAFKEGVLHVRRPGEDPIPAPFGKFIVFRYGTLDSPWGKGLLDVLYWPWFIKKHGKKFWAIFVEKFAMPTAVAEYEPGADEDLQAKAEAIAANIQSRYAMALPKGLIVKYLEASRGGNVTYGEFLGFWTKEMSLVYSGEVNTSGLRPGVGAYASDEIAQDIRLEAVELDAQMVETALGQQLFCWITVFNYGPNVAVPCLCLDTTEAEDREKRQQALEKAIDRGVEVTERQFRQTFQARQPRPGEATVQRSSEPQPAPPRPDQKGDR